MNARERAAATTALLGQYTAQVQAMPPDPAEGLSALLKRIDRGELPMDLDPPMPVHGVRSRRPALVVAVGLVVLAAAALVLWQVGSVGVSALQTADAEPQAAYERGSGSVQGAATIRASVDTVHTPMRHVAPVAAPLVVPLIVPPPVDVASPAEVVATPRPRASRPSTPAVVPAAPVDAVAEVRALATARSALRDGDAASALRMLADHRRAYPRSAYAEEREVLLVAALCDAGRDDEARVAATKFRRAHPGSPLAAHLSGCASGTP